MRKLTNAELNRLSVEKYREQEKSPLVIVLDNVRSQQNVGSIFRTADAFRVEAVFLCGITATPPHREIHRAALGATESVSWRYFEKTEEALARLREEGYLIVGAEQTDESVPLQDYQPAQDKKLALVFGNEVSGLSGTALPYLDACIEIPQFGTKHSFNIAVSAGIVLWDLFVKTHHF